MMYLSYFVSVVIILKWLADLFCFILSAVWFTRQKKKYVKTGMFDSTKVEIQKTYGGSKAEKTVWGG